MQLRLIYLSLRRRNNKNMGQAVSTFLGWIWRKIITTLSPFSPHQRRPHPGDNDEFPTSHNVDTYARDPELGVEIHEEAAATNTVAGQAKNVADYNGYDSCDEKTGINAQSSAGDARVVKKRWMGPYNSSQKILLVGEGDFSFSASLALAFGDASNMIATSLDSLDFLGRNYSKALRNILEMTRRGCKVMHGIDATRMARQASLKSLKFDRIIFNFPHAGFFDHYEPRQMQISRHQALVKGFLANAKKMIKEDGEVHITQKTTSFFREWNIQMLASLEGLRLVGKAAFDFQDYHGYRTKFGYGGDENFSCEPCKTYKFQLASVPGKV